jgi:hypothetical protein
MEYWKDSYYILSSHFSTSTCINYSQQNIFISYFPVSMKATSTPFAQGICTWPAMSDLDNNSSLL